MSRLAAISLVTAGTILALGACQDSSAPAVPDAPSDAVVRPADPSAAFQGVSPDQADVARTLPGFGGLFLDESGTPTIYLTDLRQRDAARAALAGLAREHGFSPSSIRVLRGDYAYGQLATWFAHASLNALAVPGVVFADLDEASNRLRIGVENAAAASRVRGVLSELRVPAVAVVVEETGPITYDVTLRNKVRPVTGGLQISFGNFLCTHGFNAIRSGVRSFITNSHCSNVQGGTEGTRYHQHSRFVSGTFIGTEAADPQYFTGGTCPAGRRCRFSDAARVGYASAATSTLGRIARTTSRGSNTGSITISSTTPTFSITAERANSVVGQTLNRIGRTSGWTFGRVVGTCFSTNVSGTNITQLCQSAVVAGSGPGDSGSPVFAWSGSGGNVTLAGIAWGSGTLSDGRKAFVFSPMSGIERELGSLTTF